MKLSILVDAIIPLEVLGNEDYSIEIEKIAYHSKDVTPQTLFVCIKGFETDGHDYAIQAVAKGADCLIVEKFIPDADVLQIKVGDTRYALAALGDEFYHHPSKDLNVFGITATNGKTSTSFMVNAILEEAGFTTGLVGTVMVKYGDRVVPSILTTPESLDLHRFLADMRDQGITHVTMEVSSFALELNRVGKVDFNYVALNNISREHIDLHGSFEEYYNAKASLIRTANKNEWAVLNLDDEHSASLVNETEAQVLTYGIKTDSGDLYCKDIDLSTGRGTFTVVIQKPIHLNEKIIEPTEFKIALSVPGYHSVYNAMVAISFALLNDISISTIQRGIQQFKGVERRFQFIHEGDFMIVDDHFANPGNINVSLETLTKMKFKDLQLVYAIRGSRGVTTNRENAETLVKWLPDLGVKRVIATTSEPYVAKKDKVLPEELKVFQEVMQEANVEVDLYPELEEALQVGLERVGPGDVLLMAGSQGMDFGGKIVLNQLVSKRPDLDAEKILAPLKDRVAGIEEL
ncbi:Mur ligase family protein [Lacticigenium naphthae]|uniref:Mur ligase family protein n=1 Tax=Lacticigenium naphthae TaxID=515351 RepID=UPI00041D15AC|nr:UDP-N-acetylmuramyl-tripeptide synthetase [Lacticigenium naphthae]